ncbi:MULTISPECIES: hypothetical protein [unclassified Caldicellulosiruptor]|uniref:hypothetical protein n=1 Tax=unclassified Caldicellulosiruptor TaxID=2622462 RepID=UPI0003A334AE|nr:MULTISPECIES: hypothetical protein [unclassified Caldicellulosiruptor]
MEIYNPQPQRDKIEKLTISNKEAAQMLGISYNVMLTLIHRRDFPKILAEQRRILRDLSRILCFHINKRIL